MTNDRLSELLLKSRKVDSITGCWLWTGKKEKDGYGVLIFDGIRYSVHRESFKLWIGGLLKGKLVCHRCDTPSCFNPSHLFSGDDQDNKNDAVKKRRHAFGERINGCKLTEAQVLLIRNDRRKGPFVALDYSVSCSTVSMIRTGKRWGYLQVST
jgi:hypothetical protein